jgi:hypothetical protein
MEFDYFYGKVEEAHLRDCDVGDLESAAKGFFDSLNLSKEPPRNVQKYETALGKAYGAGINIGERMTLKNLTLSCVRSP